ncbi:hypothetical protein GCM10009107_57490 [Ideonella azotifigens]|uniref:Uncharacterized protein n=1 Tax=Ideonella azotifigens TaxID=513160 RepID=A0ABN1KIM2_9BURK
MATPRTNTQYRLLEFVTSNRKKQQPAGAFSNQGSRCLVPKRGSHNDDCRPLPAWQELLEELQSEVLARQQDAGRQELLRHRCALAHTRAPEVKTLVPADHGSKTLANHFGLVKHANTEATWRMQHIPTPL